MAVRLLAGLGNPGPRYAGTRHNIGFALLDAFATASGARWTENSRFRAQMASVTHRGHALLLAKPQTFMNASGESLGALARYYRFDPAEVLVAYDEYTLPLGSLKISLGGSSGGHNGVASLLQHLGPDFVRFRLGIYPAEKPQASLEAFVLGKFTEAESAQLQAAWPGFLDGLRLVVDVGPQLAMNRLNQRISTHERPLPTQLPRDSDPGHPGL